MTTAAISGVITAAVITLVVVLLCWRQLRWIPLKENRPRLPLVLVVIGLVQLGTSVQHRGAAALTPVNVALLLTEVVVGALVGVLIGRAAHLRRGPAGPEARGGWPGAGLWLGLIAVRFGLVGIAGLLGGDRGVSTATVLIMVGVARFLADHTLRGRADARLPEEHDDHLARLI